MRLVSQSTRFKAHNGVQSATWESVAANFSHTGPGTCAGAAVVSRRSTRAGSMTATSTWMHAWCMVREYQ